MPTILISYSRNQFCLKCGKRRKGDNLKVKVRVVVIKIGCIWSSEGKAKPGRDLLWKKYGAVLENESRVLHCNHTALQFCMAWAG